MELIFSFVDDYEMYPSYHPYSSKTQKDYQKVLFVFLISLDDVLPPPPFPSPIYWVLTVLINYQRFRESNDTCVKIAGYFFFFKIRNLVNHVLDQIRSIGSRNLTYSSI